MASEGIKQKRKDKFSLLFAGIPQWESGEHILKKSGFLEKESQLLSRFPGVQTVGFRRAKKQSCSMQEGLRVGTSFVEFRQTLEGRGLFLLGLLSV